MAKRVYESLPLFVVAKKFKPGDCFILKHDALFDIDETCVDCCDVKLVERDAVLVLVKNYEEKKVENAMINKMCFLSNEGELLYFIAYPDYKFNKTFLKVE